MVAHQLVARPTEDLDLFTNIGGWRAQTPAMLTIGPVLAADDTVASKAYALFGRAEVRDYIDVHAAIASGRYTRAELIDRAAARDPGFSTTRFAEALTAIARHTDQDFAVYGLTDEQIGAITLVSADLVGGGRRGLEPPCPYGHTDLDRAGHVRLRIAG